jgi:outer membrane scaffolding protein for murein synthesis (MipA/OmpV family)
MTFARHHLKTITLAAGIALAAPSAFAQAFDAVHLSGAAPGMDGGSVGAALIATYQYQGSDKRRTLLLPVLDYQWANGWFAGVSNGIGVNFSGSPQTQYGLRLTADPGRKQHRASALQGMGDIDPAVEVGAFFNVALPKGLVLTSSARRGAGVDNKGVVADFGVAYSTEIAPKWYLSAGSGVTYANAHYMQPYFGVSRAQSAASGHAVYSLGAGARDLRTRLALTYSIDKTTALTTMLATTSLLGEAKDSPIVRQRASGSGVVGVTYAF